jgi:hypothetical protein
LSCIFNAVALSIETTIALPTESAPQKMTHDVLGHRVQPVIACDHVVLSAQVTFELLFLGFVQVLPPRSDCIDVIVEIGIFQPQLGRAILVIERDCRAVLDGLLEVINRNVVAEDFAGPLLARR